MEKFEILLYSVPEGKVMIEVIFEQETFWLSQKKIAELFNVSVPTINEHLQNIFTTKELEKDSVNDVFHPISDCRKFIEPPCRDEYAH